MGDLYYEPTMYGIEDVTIGNGAMPSEPVSTTRLTMGRCSMLLSAPAPTHWLPSPMASEPAGARTRRAFLELSQDVRQIRVLITNIGPPCFICSPAAGLCWWRQLCPT